MKRSFTILMTAFLLMFSYAGLAQVVSDSTYSTPSVSGLPEGWSGEDGGGTYYIKLIDATHYIQTASFEQIGFTSITLKARKFGGPSATQAQITVSWYDSEDVETVLGTIDPTSTTLTNYTINAPTAGNGTGYIKIQNKGASSNKGSGVSEVTITYTAPGGTAPTTYTVTYNANVTGVAPIVDTYVEGANVILRGADTFTNDGYTFSEWNTQADGDGDSYDAGDVIEDIQANIDLYAIWTENPVSDEQWVLANLADLTESDVFVIVGNNGSHYAMANNGGTNNAPTAVAVTVENDAITSTVAANIQWTISGDATDGYTFYPNGSTTTWLYCYNNNNGLRVGTGEDNTFVMNSNYLYNSGQGRYIGIYQSSNWRCYTTINNNIAGQTFAFYKKVTGGVLPPSIIAENVSIQYNATSGAITYTIENGVDGGSMNAATTSNWLTLGNDFTSPIAFTCTANEAATERTATVTLTYTYNRETTTKDVTVTQAGNPNVLDNISDITEVGADYHVKGMVVATSNKGFIICDGTGLVYTYLNAVPTQQVGDFIQITGTTSNYNHVIQFTSAATIAEAEEFDFEWPDYTVITAIPNYTEGDHLSDYFQFEGTLTKSGSNYFVAVGEGQIRLSYPTSEQVADLETLLNKTVRIHGFFTGYSSNNSNAVFTAMMESYEEVTAPAVPTITVAPATAQAFTYVVGNGPSEDQLFVPTGANLTSNITVTVTENGAFEIISDNYSEYGYMVTIGASNYGVDVHLKAGLEVGSYTDNLTFSSEGAENVVIALTGTVTAPEAPHFTWDLSIASYDEGASADLVTWSSDFATMTNAKGSSTTGANNYLGNGSSQTHTRFYQNQVLSITPVAGYAVDSIVINATSASYGEGFTGNSWTNATASANGAVITVVPTDGDEPFSVVISKACRATGVTVYYRTSTNVYYNITLSYGEHGIITSDKTTAREGDTVMIAIIPDEYYYAYGFGFAFCTGVTLDYDEIEPDVYRVIMPACDLSVSASFATYYDLHTITIDEDIENGTVVADKVEAPENALITLTVTPAAGYILEDNNLIVVANTANVELTKENATTYTFEMPAEDVTVTAEFTAIPPTTYTRATYIESGRHYIIVGFDDDDAYAMGQQSGNNRAAVAISVDGDVATVNNTEVFEFVINDVAGVYKTPFANSTENVYVQRTIYDPASSGYLYAASSGSNHLKTETHLDANDNALWYVSYDYNTGITIVVAYGTNTRNRMRYNSTSNVFSCYGATNTQQDVYLYVKNEDTPTYDFYKDVKGYGTSEGGYCMIATPTNDAANPSEAGLITDDGTDPDNFTYDLYSFDFTQDLEWRNYRAGAFDMVNGGGYLYANKNSVTLHFQGSPYANNQSQGGGMLFGPWSVEIPLQFDEDTNYTFNGFNLVGNPLPIFAGVDKDFYAMNADGTEVELAERTYVNPMEGVFMKATEANQQVWFEEWIQMDEWELDNLGVRVSGNNGSGDFARIRFGEGHNLEKFMLNQNHTKLYFPQGNQDYAVVRSANEGEMPVSFKAEENGTYTFSVNTESVEMNYLHLIDNMTGDDVDLLANPSYTFEAKTTDYTSRFKLVFSANNSINENANETFAFFNGSEWCISNVGEATLQVVDVTGRIVSSKTVNGNATLTTDNLSAGVYVMRLVNGNNVKMQKVVVK